jgi:hypothetical protein
MKSAKSFMHPKIGGGAKGSGFPAGKRFPGQEGFQKPFNPYKDARTKVTIATGGKTKPAGRF